MSKKNNLSNCTFYKLKRTSTQRTYSFNIKRSCITYVFFYVFKSVKKRPKYFTLYKLKRLSTQKSYSFNIRTSCIT